MSTDLVVVVAFGDEIHVYDEADRASAESVYTTAIGANLDAHISLLASATWERIRNQFEEAEIHYHLESA